ncbi:hypothetical protein T459_23315 [Capsicum annuum]|uniref:Uncharacterized protein n=1 Tax=Capsicum annuum TaxID=4072 RepID=A0A2G2YS10_CAPAN|nr:hypothetical protein T459_23315 [Capsicum annuum]
MFSGVNLSPGFKMPKFGKYDGHGDPVAYLRQYCNELRGAGGKEELLMAYFGESLSGLASECIEDCRALKREIEKMIQDKSIMVQNINSEEISIHADMQTSGEDVRLSN